QDSLHWARNHGFPFAVVHLDCAETPKLVMKRGAAWVWGPVHRLGSGKTREEVLARMSLLKRGTPVRLDDLPRARKLLSRSGWFASVGEAQLFRSSNRNQLHPAFPIEEQSTNEAEGWFSYQNDGSDSGGSWTGHISLTLDNISGTGRSLELLGETSDDTREASFSYREPYPLGAPLVAQVEAGMWTEDSTEEKEWGELGTTWRLDFEWSAELSTGISHAREDDATSDSRWGALAVTRDGRDRQPLPRQGWLWSLELTGGRRKIQDSTENDTTRNYAKCYTEFGLWLPLHQRLGWVNQSFAEALWPHDGGYLSAELLSLGGEILAGYWPGAFKTTAYADWQSSLRWTWSQTQALVFVEGARLLADDAWEWHLSYGLGWEQQTSGVGLGLRLAWNEDSKPLEGLLSLALRTKF
ncbi:MAG TPA: hypothetical protein VLM37_02850, partial [Fibrobacteraceae bacterium]|nr:hypothetical protein [Fibrobacteraceae bacterium]